MEDEIKPPSPGHSDASPLLLSTSDTDLDNVLGVSLSCNAPSGALPNVVDSGLAPDNPVLCVSDGVTSAKSPLVTLEPFVVSDCIPKGNENILFVESLPVDMNFESITKEFEAFGSISEIRLKLGHNYLSWQVWLVFNSHKEALHAYSECLKRKSRTCSLADKVPPGLKVYYPSILVEEVPEETTRMPLPSTWLIATVNSERGNLFTFRKQLRRWLGGIANSRITRFGRNSFLIHASSFEEAVMILNLRTSSDGVLKEVKPHFTFSYAKGVIFNRDLYELPQEEILELCPPEVWKVFKVPNSTMIILTFNTDHRSEYIVIDSERFKVRPWQPRPLQCFHCFGFGHSATKCTKTKICGNCSFQDHEDDCSTPYVCVNCKENHSAKDKMCKVYKNEELAVIKAHDDHISIGHAKMLMSKTKSYSVATKSDNFLSKVVPKNQSAVAPRPSSKSSVRKKSLPECELEISLAPPSSCGEVSQPVSKRAPPASVKSSTASVIETPQASVVEASQASLAGASQSSLPQLGKSQSEGTLYHVSHTVEVHDDVSMESASVVAKRPRTPSSSPHRSPRKSYQRGNSKQPEVNEHTRSSKNLSALESGTKSKLKLSRPTSSSSKTPKVK